MSLVVLRPLNPHLHRCKRQAHFERRLSLSANTPAKPPAMPERIEAVLRLREQGHGVIRSPWGNREALKEIAMSQDGAADNAESLAGGESPYRHLPVFRRLAYPGRVEATKHEMLGRRSPSCPAAVFAAVGTIRGASKLGGRNITKYLQCAG